MKLFTTILYPKNNITQFPIELLSADMGWPATTDDACLIWESIRYKRWSGASITICSLIPLNQKLFEQKGWSHEKNH